MPLNIFFDNRCPFCTQFAKRIHRLNPDLILTPLRDNLSQEGLDAEKALKAMASTDGVRWHYGYDTLVQIVRRTKWLWPAWPLFALGEFCGIGSFLYQELAVRRKIIPLHCEINRCQKSTLDFYKNT